MHYRRMLIPGATYFFTLNLQNRNSRLLTNQIAALRDAFKRVQQIHHFYIDAIIILPEHLHMIITLPPNALDYSKRLSRIKAIFSMQIQSYESISISRQKKRERGIWQRRFWEHMIRDQSDYEHHINYIHYNPVKHGYVKNPSDWPYSSIHRFIRQGIFSEGWASDASLMRSGFGEW
ncbi:transposase [Legionella lytica]|uniref:Transposase n=1 Tax=Legionella lytica TaxID=96232 RepID=A0ABY4Y7I9_9GAMM|nr:transposase [Legionella lytica]USQ13599.1 transposase [Legionella lytica]